MTQRVAVQVEVGWGPGQVWPVGQDAAWAARLARRFVTVGGIVQAVERAIDEGLAAARRLRPLAEGSPLAVAHGTRYPIVQGPMTRVSDNVPFAVAVAEGGGLPFLALALMRGPEVRTLLAEAAARLAGRAWGVGILGFVPPELRHEQMEEIRRARPPFALIAGGRPDQARGARGGGDRHLPARPLARLAPPVSQGRRAAVRARRPRVRRPRRAAVELRALGAGGRGRPRSDRRPGVAADEIHLLFAGGIHDARSAAAVAALAAPLAERGVQVGVLIGTAYLFTAEAVATGAIVPGFQDEAIRCADDGAAGDRARATRSASARRRSPSGSRTSGGGCWPRGARPRRSALALEALNAGRLRVAAKGIDRSGGGGLAAGAVAEPEQVRRGLYMLGQAATLRDRVTTIAELHHEISAGGTRGSSALAAALGRGRARSRRPARRGRDRRHVGDRARRRRRPDVLGEHAPGPRRDHRGPARPLGLAALLTTPTRRRPTRSPRSGAGSSPRSPSTRSATACRRRACRRSSRSIC